MLQIYAQEWGFRVIRELYFQFSRKLHTVLHSGCSSAPFVVAFLRKRPLRKRHLQVPNTVCVWREREGWECTLERGKEMGLAGIWDFGDNLKFWTKPNSGCGAWSHVCRSHPSLALGLCRHPAGSHSRQACFTRRNPCDALSPQRWKLSKCKLHPGFEAFKKQIQSSSIFLYYTSKYYFTGLNITHY